MKTMSVMLFILGVNQVKADADFEKLWKSISEKSLVLKSSHESVMSSEYSKKRADHHWMPTLYLNESSYYTNDAGANMFGLLSQRSITQQDFAPDKLNHPDSTLFSKATVGVNMPLYEGGMKTSIAKASEFQYESKKLEESSNQVMLYTEVAKNYFSLKSLQKFNKDLGKIRSTLDSIIGKYQIGNKSNMLGYSGLLGLRSLKNRIIALGDESNARFTSYQKALNELNGEKTSFTYLDSANYLKEVEEYLVSSNENYQETNKVKALNLNAKAASEIVGAEKSRNLPRVGLFAESFAFNGERKTDTGYSAGLYVHWNLFSGNDMGATEEAIHNSHAAKFYAEASAQKEKMEFNSLNEMDSTLVKTLSTLEESQKLLDEQTVVANNLFKNGMINALQLTEVFSRRVDLLKSKSDAELNLIETKAKKRQLASEELHRE